MPSIDLGALPWHLAQTARLPFAAPLDDPGSLHDWIDARVPGSIQRDLMAAGRLPDLYRLPDPGDALAWVDGSDWWYRSELPRIETGERAWLRFAGIDYQAAVTLGGRELGRGAGMFAARQWEVTEFLASGARSLGVRVWGGGALPAWPNTLRRRLARFLVERVQGGIPAFGDRLLTLKAPLHFGWDFAPRLLAAGIWDKVSLHRARGVGLLDLWARADWGPDRSLIMRLEVDADRARSARLHADLISANRDGQEPQMRSWQLALAPGPSTIYVKWPRAHLRPWATHERGTPQLYRLQVRLSDGEGLLDEIETRVGARTVGWDGAGRLILNGSPLFLRGANWAPLDLLRGDAAEPERMRSRLRAAVDAGINALRVWGGGGRERGLFYDLCDELGLLVWQELPIACVFFDHMPEDDAFLTLARRETTGIVRQLRGHPSLALWGGGNEWGPGRHRRLAATLGETVARHDPSRRWLPASPGPGDSHNWQVWHDFASPARYAADPAALLSEFGLAAPPAAETLADMLPHGHLWPPGPAWTARKAEVAKLAHYASAVSDSHLADDSHFVSASQKAQARGLQAGIETYRLRQGAVGCFIWQWNEPWPAICWSVIPYWGPPKAAYEQIARSSAPLAPIARLLPAAIELWIVNDRLVSPGECTLTAMLDGRVLWAGTVTPPENGRMRVTSIERPANLDRAGRSRLLELHLRGPGIDARNDYRLDLDFREPGRMPGVRWLRERVKAWLLRW